MTDPIVGVAPTKLQKGIDFLGDPNATALLSLPLSEALAGNWDTDAHLCTYRAVSPHGQYEDQWPRCNKPSLGGIREAGGDLHVQFVALDYDNPGHKAWEPDGQQKFVGRLGQAAQNGFAPAGQWSYFYFTQHGARLLYVLSQPASVECAEGLVAGLVRDFLIQGILMDSGCSDWTRLFRLPRVIRDGTKTWEQPYFGLIGPSGHLLDPLSITPGEARKQQDFGDYRRESLSMPTPEECRALVEVYKEGSQKPSKTDFYKAAKKALVGRDCFWSLFSNRALASRGNRNSEVQRLVGEAVAVLLPSIPKTSAQEVFALFFPALEQLNADDPFEPEDFVLTGWKAIQQYHAKESAKIAHALQQKQLEHQNLVDRILAGVRGWRESEQFVPADREEAIRWLGGNLLASDGRGFYVMTQAGYYDTVSVTKTTLVSRIRELGMDEIIPLFEEVEGKVRKVPAQAIIDRHTVSISSSEGEVGAKGTYIKRNGTDATLVQTLYRRRDIAGQYDPQVDHWLRLLTGENYPLISAWVGHGLAFEAGPICALSMAGGPGSGKKLFYQGLAECIDTGLVASSKEFGRFQGLLMKTPWVVINEGWHPTNGMHLADTFRQMTSGDPLYIEQKYREPVLIKNPLRLIFLANNTDVVQMLTGDRDLSPEDRDALAVRILHHDVGDEAAEWLRSRGGLAFTRGWVGGDDGSPSQFRVARHFLWLYENRPQVPDGNRLLVEGNMTEKMVYRMSTQSGRAPAVIEAIIRMIESATPGTGGLVISDGEIYVTTSAVVNSARSFEVQGHRGIDHRVVSKVLKGLVSVDDLNTVSIKETKSGPKEARWRKLDLSMLLDQAREHGYPCSKLEKARAVNHPLDLGSVPTVLPKSL